MRADPRVLVLGAAVLWGTTGTAQALGPPGASPVAVGAARILVAGTALVALAAWRGTLHGSRPWPPGPTLAAGVAMAAYQPLFFAGVRATGVAVGTMVAIGSAPVLAGLGAWARGERPGGRWAAATALAVAGCALLLLPGQARVDPAGVLLALGAGAAYATYLLASKALLASRPVTAVVAVSFGLAALLLAPVLAATGAGPLLTPRGLAVALHLGLVATALAYLLYGRGLAGTSVATAATLSLAEPLTAALLGTLLLGERPEPVAAAGAALLLCGLALLAVPGRRAAALPS